MGLFSLPPKNPGITGAFWHIQGSQTLDILVCSHRAFCLGFRLFLRSGPSGNCSILAVQMCMFELSELYIEIVELGKLFSRVLHSV